MLKRPDTTPLAEAETRCLNRNRNPMWEEWLPFPLNDVTKDMEVKLRIMDKDIGHFISFVGQVCLPIKTILCGITELGDVSVATYELQDRSGTGRRPGSLVLGTTILPKEQYMEAREVLLDIQDPTTVHQRLSGHCLHMRLHKIAALAQGVVGGVSVGIRLCCYERSHTPLTARVVLGEVEPELDVVIPLGEAFKESGTLKGRNRAEFGDVKIDLYIGTKKVARTQVPIWDVPFRPEPQAVPQSQQQQGKNQATGAAAGVNAAAAGQGWSSAGGLFGRVARMAGMRRTAQEAQPAAQEADAAPAPAAPPPPPAPLWAGKRYARRMERVDSSQSAAAPLLHASMQLVPADVSASASGAASGTATGAASSAAAGAGAGVSSGGGGAVDLDAEDVEAPAEALAAPAPFEESAVDMTVPCGPRALWRAMFKDAGIQAKLTEKEKLRDVSMGPWESDQEGKALTVRRSAYQKPTPVGYTNVKMEQKLLTMCDGGWVVETRITPTVPPVGQCVHIILQVVAQHSGTGKTRLTVSYKLEWFQSGFLVDRLKGKVASATPGDIKLYYDALQRALGEHLGVPAAAAAEPGAAAAGGVAAGAPAAAASFSAASAGGVAVSAGAGSGSSSLLNATVAVAAALLLLVLLLWRISADVARAGRALEAVAAAAARGGSAAQLAAAVAQGAAGGCPAS